MKSGAAAAGCWMLDLDAGWTDGHIIDGLVYMIYDVTLKSI
jgi:hypothetical protein